MSLHSEIREEINEAARQRQREKLTVLRSIIAEFTNEAIKIGHDRSEDLPDDKAQDVISRLVKQRRDSIDQFESAGRTDLAEAEKNELSILEKYLPQQMSQAEIEEYLKKKIQEMGIKDRSELGNLMSTTMKELKGQADGKLVKETAEKVITDM
ncbi:MAG: GatB/YqeY domain-containing protein [Candidatus Paceibacterota bacterium]